MIHDAGFWVLFTFIFLVLMVCAVGYAIERKNRIWSGPLDIKEFREKLEAANKIIYSEGPVGELYKAIDLLNEAFGFSGPFAERIDFVIDEIYEMIRNYKAMYRHNHVGCAAARYWEHVKYNMKNIRVSLDSINEELGKLLEEEDVTKE